MGGLDGWVEGGRRGAVAFDSILVFPLIPKQIRILLHVKVGRGRAGGEEIVSFSLKDFGLPVALHDEMTQVTAVCVACVCFSL